MDAFDRNEPSIVVIRQTVKDLERHLSDKTSGEKTIAPLKRTSKSNIDKFSDLRKKLKAREATLERDLEDTEKYHTLTNGVEDRVKKVEYVIAEVKESGNEPEDIKECLEVIKVS